MTNFKFSGKIATIAIAYEAVLAVNIPNSLKAQFVKMNQELFF
ncbi:MAG: hypothetical protein ACMUHX_10330 [bacterium]